MIEDFQYPSSGLGSPTVLADVWQNGIVSSCSQALPANDASDSSGKQDCSDVGAGAKELEFEFERGRAQGIIEGRSAERADMSANLQRLEADKVEYTLDLNEQFTRERDQFMQSIEPKVVKLAIAVASLVLRRELQFDPLLLIGAVRIALKEVGERTSVRIRVPAMHADLWSETVDRLPNLRAKPTIVADNNLQDGECRLETEMGSVDIGLQNQLAEIAGMLLDSQAEREPRTSNIAIDTMVQP